MGIRIITDSGADLPREIAEKYNIGIVPLEIRFKDQTYLDGIDLSNEEFYRLMKKHEKLPKTASPSPEQFITEFDKSKDDILVITLSSGLSATYNSALIAKKIYEDKNNNRTIRVIDSLSASVGEGLLALKAAQLALKDLNIDEIAVKLNNYAREGQIFFLLDTLDNIVKGGRIGKVKAHIATLLSIKLIMKSDGNGVVDLAEKVRGDKKAFNRLVEIIGENGSDFENKTLAIGHSACYEKALKYKEAAKNEYGFKQIFICSIGATIGTYAGEGGVLVSFI